MKNEYTQLDFVFAKEVQNLRYPEFLKTVNTHMRRLLKISGIDKELPPHSLRHTHTSLLIKAGVGVKEIQQRLGHGDINTIYTRTLLKTWKKKPPKSSVNL
ncbi:tyrosine-type recombinase/integrase [Thalassobacillus devorans]|uniref:tyrosine-type recombinase/integrase n=1 Tax=Thalassobacillus devorans TaxID=279813 RepID=UPI0020CAF8FE|nr:tyrosine-type recombinase/integrase [Thalassobacillus devorans]